MARTTIKKINALLPEGIEIVKGVDYFYFATEIGSKVADELDPNKVLDRTKRPRTDH